MATKITETAIYNEPGFQMWSIDRVEETTFGDYVSVIFVLLCLWPVSFGIIRVISGADRFWKLWNFVTDDLVGFAIGILWIPIEAIFTLLFSPFILFFG